MARLTYDLLHIQPTTNRKFMDISSHYCSQFTDIAEICFHKTGIQSWADGNAGGNAR